MQYKLIGPSGHVSRAWEMNPYWQRNLAKRPHPSDAERAADAKRTNRAAHKLRMRKVVADISRGHVKAFRIGH